MTPRALAHLIVISVLAILVALPWAIWGASPFCTIPIIIGAGTGLHTAYRTTQKHAGGRRRATHR